ALTIQIEPVVYVFRQDRGCEWPETLAVLNLEIKDLLCVERTWVGQDRSIAERAGPKFHPALRPSDRLAFTDCAGRGVDDRVFVGENIESGALRVETFLDFALRELGPEIAAIHCVHPVGRCTRIAKELMVGGKCRPNGASGIAGRRLNPDILEFAIP